MSRMFFYKPFNLIVNKNIYNYFYKKHIRKCIDEILKNPIYINIETTNICNADCVMCPHSKMKRKQGVMDERLFKHIIDKIIGSKLPVKEFVLSGFGEPLVDRFIFNRIEYIKSKGNFYTKLFTNVSLLNEENSNNVVNSDLDEIVISFNGISSEVYEKVMRKLEFERSLTNANGLLNLIQRSKIEKPKVVISCVRLEINKKEIRKIRKFWDGKVSQILKPIPENWSGNLKQNSPWLYIYKKKLWPCRGLWDTLDFLWDGRVSLCCRDYEGNKILGDISSNSILDILNYKRSIGYKHLEGDYSETPICLKCDTAINNSITWW